MYLDTGTYLTYIRYKLRYPDGGSRFLRYRWRHAWPASHRSPRTVRFKAIFQGSEAAQHYFLAISDFFLVVWRFLEKGVVRGVWNHGSRGARGGSIVYTNSSVEQFQELSERRCVIFLARGASIVYTNSSVEKFKELSERRCIGYNLDFYLDSNLDYNIDHNID